MEGINIFTSTVPPYDPKVNYYAKGWHHQITGFFESKGEVSRLKAQLRLKDRRNTAVLVWLNDARADVYGILSKSSLHQLPLWVLWLRPLLRHALHTVGVYADLDILVLICSAKVNVQSKSFSWAADVLRLSVVDGLCDEAVAVQSQSSDVVINGRFHLDQIFRQSNIPSA